MDKYLLYLFILNYFNNLKLQEELYTLFNLPACSVNDVLLVLLLLKTDGILIISLRPKPKEAIMLKAY